MSAISEYEGNKILALFTHHPGKLHINYYL